MSLLHYAGARTAQLAVTRPQAGQSGVSIPAGGRNFLFSEMSRLTPSPTPRGKISFRKQKLGVK
jgi:hypothetical protein